MQASKGVILDDRHAVTAGKICKSAPTGQWHYCRRRILYRGIAVKGAHAALPASSFEGVRQNTFLVNVKSHQLHPGDAGKLTQSPVRQALSQQSAALANEVMKQEKECALRPVGREDTIDIDCIAKAWRQVPRAT
ncbi:hypothetical protein GCM10007857_77270 [Bradyrhizobium iriomotense]|uniref:Uncharacterized protein n=1 Tax=Bradyrhizobium iriomotense TaxID=441950 RepID=A0ABQ6BEF2_9BRAD|nr:hypothetical protein [Bradyrhizobium iriomotense]GLR91011.1 hypothetical protein GCM10007857_77270 [Bradyrhizobium iriomotense]